MKNSFYGVLKAKKGGLKMGEKKNIKQSHSRMFLSGIFDACRCKIKGKIPELARVRLALSGSSTHAVVVVKQGNPLLNKRQTARVEDPETSSGITLFDERQMARGFTLIELLVVVLIIGILAAVALPQYQFAVTKTRIKTYLPVLADMAAANELYYLANGVYAEGNQVEDLDITMPSSCTHLNSNVWKCDTDFMLDSSNQNGFILHYCPKSNSSYNTCTSNPNRILSIVKYYNNYSSSAMAGKWFCAPHSDLGTKLCNSLLD